MNVTMPESEFGNTVVRKHFPAPDVCYDELLRSYGGATTTGNSKYLFRGEACYYPTSTPGTYRVLTAGYPTEIKFARIDATGLFVDDYEQAGGDPGIGEALAQHYLSTSDGLDFSASLGVALAFALDEKEVDAPRFAYIAVLDYDQAMSSNRFSLHDLRGMGASRPDRQCGFVAVHHAGHFVDLKAPGCRRELGLTWYSFTVAPGDVIRNRHPEAPHLGSLYDIRGDPWAATMIQHLDNLISEPSSQWGKNGRDHLIDARNQLLSRTGTVAFTAGS
jgi:hypothetical protein